VIFGEKFLMKYWLGVNDMGNLFSRCYYGNYGGVLMILLSSGLKKWDLSRKIVEVKCYDVGDVIVIFKLL